MIGIAALFITTFITAFIKAKLGNSRPSIKTATSLLHILLFVTITQLANEDALEYLPYKTTRIILALLGGTIISCLGCYLIYPYTASTKLKRSINATFPIIGLEIDILVEIILLKSTPQSIAYQVDHHQIAFQKLKIESNVLLSSIHEMKKESFFEFWTTLYMHRKAFNVIIVCIERCFQFSNAVNTAAMMIEIDTKQERMIELAVHILEKCNNAVTMLSYGN